MHRFRIAYCHWLCLKRNDMVGDTYFVHVVMMLFGVVEAFLVRILVFVRESIAACDV